MHGDIGFFDIFWSIFWLFLMVAWFWVVISVVTDVFRSRDIGGVMKALWVLFIIGIPWLGVLSYILLRGDKMQQNQAETMKHVEDSRREYIRGIAAISPAEELEKLVALKDKGVLTDAEFAAQKTRILTA